ncbi:hypothetical protein PF003_g22298 [Phytophthora fragariae]|nr:hypothetical protein PF003_g22298 [Phytophthora fragariae]
MHSDLIKRMERPRPEKQAALPSVNDVVEKQTVLIKKQMDMISSLSSQLDELRQRMAAMEDGGSALSKPTVTTGVADAVDIAAGPESETTAPKRRSSPKSLAAVWYEWFSSLSSKTKRNRRRYHEVKVTVAFMRIFLPRGYDVTGTDSSSKARVLKAGEEAEEEIHAFLGAKNKKSKAFSTVVKTLKKMYAEGKLNKHIARYQARCAEGLVLDGSPAASVHVLLPQPLQDTQHNS